MIKGNVVHSEQVIPVDIDGTLIRWVGSSAVCDFKFWCPFKKEEKYVKKHLPNIAVFEERMARGAFFLVWSASGFDKAQAVMKGLGYEGHPQVLVLSKPVAYMDDIPCQEWMGPRIWLEPDSNYGR